LAFEQVEEESLPAGSIQQEEVFVTWLVTAATIAVKGSQSMEEASLVIARQIKALEAA